MIDIILLLIILLLIFCHFLISYLKIVKNLEKEINLNDFDMTDLNIKKLKIKNKICDNTFNDFI